MTCKNVYTSNLTVALNNATALNSTLSLETATAYNPLLGRDTEKVNLIQNLVNSLVIFLTETRNEVEAFDYRIDDTEVVSIPIRNVNIEEYPYLRDRVRQLRLTNYDIADFIVSTRNNETDILEVIIETPAQVLEEIDYWLNNDYAATISSNFCSTFASVFSKIYSAIRSAVNTINDLQNFNLNEFFADFVSRLQSMKELIFKIIDGLVERIREQLTRVFTEVTGRITQSNAGINRIVRLYNEIRDIYQERGVAGIKEEIERIIANMANQFEELTADNIELILFQLCQMIQSVQSFFNSPLEYFKNYINGVNNSLSIYNLNYQRIANERRETSGIGIPRDEADDIAAAAMSGDVPSYRVGDAFIRSRIPIHPRLVRTATSFTLEPANAGPGNYTAVYNRYLNMGSNVIRMGKQFPYNNESFDSGWRHEALMQIVWPRAYLIGELLGAQLTINSAYRNPPKNANVDGATNSNHMRGFALDIANGNHSTGELAGYAAILGFGEIIFYNSFIHIGFRTHSRQSGISYSPEMEQRAMQFASRYYTPRTTGSVPF